MTAQEPAVTGQGGEVLGEEAQQRVWSVTAKALRGDPDAADAVTHALAPVVAALVAQARADGAAEERERIARERRPARLSDVVGAEEAARLVREEHEREQAAQRLRARRRRGTS